MTRPSGASVPPHIDQAKQYESLLVEPALAGVIAYWAMETRCISIVNQFGITPLFAATSSATFTLSMNIALGKGNYYYIAIAALCTSFAQAVFLGLKLVPHEDYFKNCLKVETCIIGAVVLTKILSIAELIIEDLTSSRKKN